MSLEATKQLIGETLEGLDYPVKDEGVSRCPSVLGAAADFGKPEKKDLVNAGVAAEFFYKALYDHYWKGKGIGPDVILGDYYGSVAIIFAAKLEDRVVLEKFCKAIQDASNEEDGKYDSAGRLAKVYGASAYVGAYLAGLSGSVLDDFYDLGEKTGLKVLGALEAEEWKEMIGGISESADFVANLGISK